MLYTIIYDYLSSLFGTNLTQYSGQVLGVSINLQEWLCHTGTIVVLTLLCVALGGMVVYLFKLFANMWR